MGSAVERGYRPDLKILRRRPGGIDNPPPVVLGRPRYRGQFEIQALPLTVDHAMEHEASTRTPDREGEAMGVLTPVRLVEFHPVPHSF